jgi:hypothetical protein
MYIHNYQIHNVLNEYRKQLIGRPAEEPQRRSEPSACVQDRVNISKSNQRQAIMDQVSAEIVDRITKHGGRNQFEDAIGAVLHYPSQDLHGQAAEFTYTLIDEQNQKVTGTLEFRTLRAAIDGTHDVSGNPESGSQSIDQGSGSNPGRE